MTFTIPKTVKKVTREFLLEHNTEETYMQNYLGVPVKKGLFISPIRHDKRPTASFFRSRDGALLFHDFGIGFKADFVGVVRQLFNLSYNQALNKIASDLGLKLDKSNKCLCFNHNEKVPSMSFDMKAKNSVRNKIYLFLIKETK